MENIESIDDNFSEGEMKITGASLENLRQTARWTNFLAIVGFIMIGLMMIGMLGLIASQGMSRSRYGGGMDTGIVILIYLIMIVVYFFPVYYMYQFSGKMKSAINQKDSMTFTTATDFLKKHFQFVGVLVIIGLSLYALAFLVLIGGALS